jgi:drug/metabolite transporter (DMT)-like permease
MTTESNEGKDRLPSLAANERFKGLGSLALCALLWSSAGILIKLVSWHPLAIASCRSLIGFLAMLLFYRRLPRFKFSWPLYLGALMNALTMFMFVSANKLTTSANAILLQYSSPLWTALFGAVLLKEKPKTQDLVFAVLVIAAMALFFMDKLSARGSLGNVLAILSGVSFGLFFVCMKMHKGEHPGETVMLSHLMAFIAGLPFVFLSGPPSGASSYLGIGLLGVFQIGVAGILLSYGIKRAGALESMLTTSLEPVFNPVWVFLFLGEKPSPWAIAGGSAIVLMVGLRPFMPGLLKKIRGR